MRAQSFRSRSNEYYFAAFELIYFFSLNSSFLFVSKGGREKKNKQNRTGKQTKREEKTKRAKENEKIYLKIFIKTQN